MRAIDGDALESILRNAITIMKSMTVALDAEDDKEFQMEIKAYTDILNGVKEQPTIEPERKKGKWIMKYKGSAVTSYKCSECGRTVKDDTDYDVSKDYPFCHCGADMRENNND